MNPAHLIFRCLVMSLVAWAICIPWAKGDSIGFFYALDADLRGIKSIAQELGQAVSVGTRSIHRLRLGSHTIYAIKMGSGVVETAASAQALLGRFRCDWAFSLGPAGALSEAVQTGGWHRVERVLAWQRGNTDTSWNTDWARFPGTNLPAPLQTTSTISVASGEQFISSASERDRLQAVTQADAVDMNSFGLALVCADHGVPLFAWKIISDRADEEATETFKAFRASYSGEGGKALAGIIQSLPANPNDPASYPAIGKLLRENRLPDTPPSSANNP